MVTKVLKRYQAFPAFTRRVYTNANDEAQAYPATSNSLPATSVYSPTKQFPVYKNPAESLTGIKPPPLTNQPVPMPPMMPANTPVQPVPVKKDSLGFLKDKKTMIVIGVAVFSIIILAVLTHHKKR